MTGRFKFILLFLILPGCQKVDKVPDKDLLYLWSGAPTPDGITIKFKTAGPDEVKIFTLEKSTGDTVFVSNWITTSRDDYFTNGIKIEDLDPLTSYSYGMVLRNSPDRLQGEFQTTSTKPVSFSFAFGSCARTGSKGRVFGTINDFDPLFYMNVGDWHYGNIDKNCELNFVETYFDNLGSRKQAALYRDHPFVYIWDDHDYGPNNSSADSPCQSEALNAYKSFIPHYPLAFEGDDRPISQQFSVGRVQFILTDLRSQKIKPEYEGCKKIEPGTNFGSDEHLEWFKKTLLRARDSGKVVAWVNPIPWISSPESRKWECDEDDDWGGFQEERTDIANFISKNNIPLFILSGDGHMVAIDDGSNSDFATIGGSRIPVFHAAPLDNVGILKGGPYSHGYSRKRGQFGWVEINDEGDNEVCITFTGYNYEGDVTRNRDGEPIKYTFCMNPYSSLESL